MIDNLNDIIIIWAGVAGIKAALHSLRTGNNNSRIWKYLWINSKMMTMPKVFLH